MAKHIILSVFFLVSFFNGYSQQGEATLFNTPIGIEGMETVQPKKGTVLALTLLLGPIGGHRVLLGTKTIVPVLYAVTLGGGLGLVPLIDFFVCLFKKDLSHYQGDGRFLMWLRNEKTE